MAGGIIPGAVRRLGFLNLFLCFSILGFSILVVVVRYGRVGTRRLGSEII